MSFNRRRILGLVIKEFRQLKRDPRMLRVLLISPIIQLVVFGYAVSTDVSDTRMFVVDRDNTVESRALIDAFSASGYFRVTGTSDGSGDLVSAIDRGRALVALEIPTGFSRDMGDGLPSVQFIVDGTQSNTGTIVLGYADRLVRDFLRAGSEDREVVRLESRAWFNPSLESRNYNVPGVIGALIFLVCLLLTSLAVVREREVGTLEQLRVSPMRPTDLLLGKAIPFGIIAMVDVLLVSAVAMLWFDVPFRGSGFLLLFASTLYVVACLSLGLIISSISKTQQEAFMTTFLVFMPAILLSGFMFPVTSMPRVFQWVTVANPMRHYLEIVRALFLKGVGVDALLPQLAMLLTLGAVLTLVAGRSFRARVV